MALCISLSNPNFAECQSIIQAQSSGDVVEIRIDLIAEHSSSGTGQVTDDQVAQLFRNTPPQGVKTIATCRDVRPEPGFTDKRLELLCLGIKSGATYVDIEYEAPQEYKDQVLACVAGTDCKVIISYHNYKETPSTTELATIVDNCFAFGGQVAKVAVQANSQRDSARVLALYDDSRNDGASIVALGMGAYGMITRAAAPLLGAPFTFVSNDVKSATAPGQLTKDEMVRALGVLSGSAREEQQ